MKSIKTQMVVILNCISIISILLVGSFASYDLFSENEQQIAQYRANLQDSVDHEMRTQVEMAVSFINKTYKEQQAGSLTPDQAKLLAADYVRDLRFGDGNYFYIDTEQGVNVVLMGRDAEGKSRIDAKDPNGKLYIKEIIANGQKEGGGYTDLLFAKPGDTNPLPKRNYSLAFKPYGWVVGTGTWIDYIDTKVAEQQKIADGNLHASLLRMLLCMLLIQIVLMFVATYIGKRFAAPIIDTTEQLNRFAQGDFSHSGHMVLNDRTDELGQMSKALGIVHKNMNELIKKIAGSVDYVASSSEELTAHADQSAQVSGQTATSMIHVAEASSKQVDLVKSAAEHVETMSISMEEISMHVVESGEQIESATGAAQGGSDAVERAIAQMALIESTVNNSAVVVSKLGTQSKEIGTIVDTIAGIAGQTNLLALNAAIEAARAGEQGRGFAVVAEEVRKLAEQSSASAKQIAELIGPIQIDTAHAVATMEEGTKQVRIGTEVVTNAGDSFKQIAVLVEGISNKSNQMAEVITTMALGTNDIVMAVQEIDTMSKNVAAEAQTVSASTQEQTASMHEIADASQALAQMAQDLQEAIVKFKV
ncbi:methyl-accepting chemotaxis protein [Propionispira raffinosivorans]|uniref:methyl-accepting chemotaxis protein n=1 Tax=Propionispira raffinosivorans TaxID=86959 RepID=UPI00037B4DED|nr:methyl-accepting chemotaxis protein [Propionispira raffinosivorans]